jgi:hypothetical protein
VTEEVDEGEGDGGKADGECPFPFSSSVGFDKLLLPLSDRVEPLSPAAI